MVKNQNSRPIRVILRKANTIVSAAGGGVGINAADLIIESGDWTEYAAMFELFKINSIKFRFLPKFSATQEAQDVIIAHGAVHNPGDTLTRGTPASLVDALENQDYFGINVIQVKNGAFAHPVKVNMPKDTFYNTEDEAASQGCVRRCGWLETQLASKTIGWYLIEWDVTFK